MTASEYGLYVNGLTGVVGDDAVVRVNVDDVLEPGLVGMVVFSIGHDDPPAQALACTLQVHDDGLLGVQIHAFENGHRVAPATSKAGMTALVETREAR